MTREQAIAKAEAAQLSWTGNWARQTVYTLEALGLLKLEEPKPMRCAPTCHCQPKTIFVPAVDLLCPSAPGASMGAWAREDTLIETLRMAGYQVFPREPGLGEPAKCHVIKLPA